MSIKKIKRTIILAMLINTILTLFMLYHYFQIVLNNYYYGIYSFINFIINFGIPLFLFSVVMIIEWYFVLFPSQNSLPIKQYLEQFIQRHSQELEPYQEEAQNTFMKYATLRGITAIIYHFILHIIFFGFCYCILIIETPAIMTLFIMYCIFFIVIIVYNLFCNYVLNKKYYLYYVDPQNKGMTYILITYYLLQVKVNEQILLPYFDLVNVSAAMGRELCFEEGYEYVQLWHKHLKKFPPIYQFLYIEHCISHLAMLDKHEDVELAYQDYIATQKKHSFFNSNKNVKRLTYSTSLAYAYNKQDWQTIIELEKTFYDFFKTLNDHDVYYFYCAYSHIDEQKAQTLLQQYPENKFFKKYVFNQR